jgi:hypothetical protein
VVTSARAIDEGIIKKLHQFNTDFIERAVQTSEPRVQGKCKVEETSWGGPVIRTMMHCIYVVSFLCLLRYDEALKIQIQDLAFEKIEEDGPKGTKLVKRRVKLSLPFRKTDQYGGEFTPISLSFVPNSLFIIAVCFGGDGTQT